MTSFAWLRPFFVLPDYFLQVAGRLKQSILVSRCSGKVDGYVNAPVGCIVHRFPFAAPQFFCRESAAWATLLALRVPGEQPHSVQTVLADDAHSCLPLRPWHLSCILQKLCISLDFRFPLQLGYAAWRTACSVSCFCLCRACRRHAPNSPFVAVARRLVTHLRWVLSVALASWQLFSVCEL